MSAPAYRTRIERRCAEGAPSVVPAPGRHDRRRVFRLWAGHIIASRTRDTQQRCSRAEHAIGAVHVCGAPAPRPS